MFRIACSSLVLSALGCGSPPAATSPNRAATPTTLTWGLLEAIADQREPALPIWKERGVFVLSEDSCAGGHPPCVPERLCGAAAENMVSSTSRTMVERNRQNPDPDLPGECAPLAANIGASTTCALPGVAEYDTSRELYVVRTATGMAVAGVTVTEVGYSDVGVFDQASREVATPSGTCP